MLNCPHHISWVRPIDGGLHQCILCHQVVTKKDVYPKLEDLPEELRRRWDAHEATRAAPPPAPAPAATPEKARAQQAPPAAPAEPKGSEAAQPASRPPGSAPASPPGPSSPPVTPE